MPSSAIPEIIRCRDCKHFRQEVWEKVCGVPLIVAHEICLKWGNGCKTSPDGFCFMAERENVTHPEDTNAAQRWKE